MNTANLPSERVGPVLARIPQYSLRKKMGMSNTLLAKDETMTHGRVRLLLGRTTDRGVSISLEAITTIEAVGCFALVHTLGGSFIVCETLATLEKALPGNTFARMNHSILNISQIEELQVLGGGGNHFQMKDGRIIALTLQLSEMESLLHRAQN